MDQNHLAERVVRIAAEVFECNRSDLTPNLSILEDLGINSISRLDFIVALERAFDVRFNLQDVEEAKTLADFVSRLEELATCGAKS